GVRHAFQSFCHTVGVGLGLIELSDTTTEEHIENFANAEHLHLTLGELIEQHASWRRNGVVLSIRGSPEFARLALEGARDDPAYFVLAAQNPASRFTDLI